MRGKMVVRPATAQKPATEAVLVLPGFGYGLEGERAIRAVAASIAAEGMDLYVPDVHFPTRPRREPREASALHS